MGTVREATFELFRRHGATTIFGNPGSTELPMLADFPDDFRYILGLQEAVVVGMADGYAQATGRPAHANLHTAPGVGNAMGAIFNAKANHSPLVITAGQQARSMMTMEANLTNVDAPRMPQPLTKWSFEVPRALDLPLALGRAFHQAALPPKGPTFVSIPMDDWDVEADPESARLAIERSTSGPGGANLAATKEIAASIDAAVNPVLVAGPDLDSAAGHSAAVALAERGGLTVWASPAPGGGRIGFPESHPNYRGVLPPAVGPLGETLREHDLIIVAGASVFSYYPNIPGPMIAADSRLIQITSDPDEAARAPFGDAVVADVALTVAALAEAIGNRRAAPEPNQPPYELPLSDPMSASNVMRILRGVWPDDAIAVVEAPTATLAVRNQLRLSRPGSWYFGAGGGLGFGLACSLGVALAEPDRKVVCILGEGSTQYAVSGFWTAATYSIDVSFLILRNTEYSILKWFAGLESVEGAPGLDLPGLDTAAIAGSYGVANRRAESAEELEAALAWSLASPGPSLVEVGVAPGMSIG